MFLDNITILLSVVHGLGNSNWAWVNGTGSQHRGLEPNKISGPNSKDLGMSGFGRGKY